METDQLLPDIITCHPEADIPIEGVTSYLIQTAGQQLVFMYFDRDLEIAEHTHEAQWGVVLEGKMELTIDGVTKVLETGNTYFIDNGVKHSARVFKGYRDLTLFNQHDRYSPKIG